MKGPTKVLKVTLRFGVDMKMVEVYLLQVQFMVQGSELPGSSA